MLGGVVEAIRAGECACVCTDEFGAKRLNGKGMSGADGNPTVPVDVVQGIVQQLATVSQHTSTATTAMIHLVSELAGLREMRTRDTTTMVEALAGASGRSWQ